VARLLVIHHSPTRAVAAITESVLAGCHDEAIEDVEIVPCRALDFGTGSATSDDILGADGYLLGTTANFGYMSGALKHVFDSTFLAIGGSLAPDGSAAPAGGSTTGRPFGLYVHGRYDTTGAVRSDHGCPGLAPGIRRSRGDGGCGRGRTGEGLRAGSDVGCGGGGPQAA
jgi:multimeric flavodoxin WrbA